MSNSQATYLIVHDRLNFFNKMSHFVILKEKNSKAMFTFGLPVFSSYIGGLQFPILAPTMGLDEDTWCEVTQ